jgi:exopolysaccharide biosynthesis polyprenyl glycosylphosphotransferase
MEAALQTSRDKPTATRSSYVERDALVTAARPSAEPIAVPRERPRRARPLHAAQFVTACVVGDAIMLASAVAANLASPAIDARADSLVWPAAFSLLVMVLLAGRGMYARRLRLRLLDDVRGLVSATAIAAMALISTRMFLGHDAEVASETVYLWLLATGLLATGRTVLVRGEARARRRGEAGQPTLIVGAGRMAHVTAARLMAEPELGLTPIGFLDAEPLEVDRNSVALPVLGAVPDLDDVVSTYGVQHVIVTFSKVPHGVLLDAVRRCRELHVPVSILPRLFEVEGERVTVERLGSLPLVGVGASDPRGWSFKAKYAGERAFASLALLLTLPLLALAAVAVRLTMGGPVFFRQRRVGADGREFDMLKLRTMKGRPEEEEEADLDWALDQLARNRGELGDLGSATAAPSGDSADRRTPVGSVLRRFSLDELPQLWNVVRGEMSLVGPRPERVRYVERFQGSIYRYGDRHRVKSGMTGWAQVNGLRGQTSLVDRIEWDNYYIENWSPWLDLKIILMTIACILRGQHEEREA